jgi:hypothetical protein
VNILEAIKSGKKLKRRPWKKKWIDPKDTGYHITLTFQDLAANDWEAEQVAVPITAQQFFHAFSEVLKDTIIHRHYTGDYVEIINAMAKKLGLT